MNISSCKQMNTTEMVKAQHSGTERRDVRALIGGIAFGLAFTALIAWAGQYLDRSNFQADQGAS